jgi:hypothetical protein
MKILEVADDVYAKLEELTTAATGPRHAVQSVSGYLRQILTLVACMTAEEQRAVFWRRSQAGRTERVPEMVEHEARAKRRDFTLLVRGELVPRRSAAERWQEATGQN